MFGLVPSRRESRSGGSLLRRTDPLLQLRGEFDNLFDRFFGSWPTAFAAEDWGMDMENRDKEILVRADAPGFVPADFDIQVSGNVLTIQAEHKVEKGKKNGHFFSDRQFTRTVTLPAGVAADKVEAHYRNGVLELHLPKTEQAQAKRIEVKSE